MTELQTETSSVFEVLRINEHEIRVTSPEGESLRLRRVESKDDVINNFIWRWAESMVNKGGMNDV